MFDLIFEHLLLVWDITFQIILLFIYTNTYTHTHAHLSFPGGSVVKNPPANAEDMGLIPGLGRFSGEGNDNALQCSCLENPMDREA